MEGWIKLHRRFLDWEWFDKPEMVQLFLFLLLQANREPKKWRGITIEIGQIVTSVDSISKQTKLSPRTVRTCLERLKSTNEVTSKSTNKFTVITICKYADYQQSEDATDKQIDKQNDKETTNERQTNDNQSTTNKNKENNKEKDNTKVLSKKKKVAARAATLERKEFFYSSLVPFVGTHPPEMIRAFFEYWSEMNRSETKMRFEQEKTWEITKRLATWANREKTNSNRYGGNKIDSKAVKRQQLFNEFKQLGNETGRTDAELLNF